MLHIEEADKNKVVDLLLSPCFYSSDVWTQYWGQREHNQQNFYSFLSSKVQIWNPLVHSDKQVIAG